MGWLRESGPMNLEVRDPALLKLFFADALPPGEILGHVQAMRRRAERMLEIFEQDILPLAEQTDANGLHYPLIASRLRPWALPVDGAVGGRARTQAREERGRSRRTL